MEFVTSVCSCGAISSVAMTVLVPISLYYLSKYLWRLYILRSARDPSTDLSHLPIPPGDFGLPIIGETLTWAVQGSDFNLIRRRKHGNVFSSNYIGKTMVKVTGPEYIKQMQRWRDSEETVLVYPSTKKMTFEVAFTIIVGLVFKDESEKDTLFDIFDAMITNLFSLPYEFPGSAFSKALKAKTEIHALLDDHMSRKWKKVRDHLERNELAALSNDDSMKNAMHFVLESIILDEKRKQNGRQAAASVDDEHTMSNEELKETTTEMLFAGYQTVASTASSAIMNLIKYPEYLKKIEDEIRAFGLLPEESEELREDHFPLDFVAENGTCVDRHPKSDINCNPTLDASRLDNSKYRRDPDKDITLDLLAKMPYLEQVFRETLRINPPILGGYRQALRTFQLGKYRVPKGWTIIYNIRDTHEAEWKEDRDFNPDRFSSENWKGDKDSKFSWIPFGGGPRICVGREFARMQFKLLIIEFVRTFRKAEFAEGKPPKLFAIPFLHPTNGLPVKLYPRNGRRETSKEK